MSDEKNSAHKALFNGVLGAFGAAIGATLIAWAGGWLEQIWGQLTGVIMSLSTHLFAQSLWPNWAAYVMSLWPAFAFVRWACRLWRSRKDSTSRFQKLTFGGVVWRWSSMAELPYGLRPYCPACDMHLVYAEHGYGFTQEQRVQLFCECCNTKKSDDAGTFADMKNRVHREIDRLVRTGQWRSRVDGPSESR